MVVSSERVYNCIGYREDRNDELPTLLQYYPMEKYNPTFKKDAKKYESELQGLLEKGSEMALHMDLWGTKNDYIKLRELQMATGEEVDFNESYMAIMGRVEEGYVFSVIEAPYGFSRENLKERAERMNASLLNAEEINACDIGIKTLRLERNNCLFKLNPKLTLLFRDEASPDPLDSIWEIETARDIEYDLEKMKFYTAIDETGNEVAIPFKNNGGFLVTGVPGSGKSASFLPLLTSMLYQDAIELTLVDGKTAPSELDDFREYGLADVYKLKVNEGERNFEEILEVLKEFDEGLAKRADEFKEKYNVTNFWDIPIDERPKMKMLVIDECQVFFNTTGKKTDEKKLIEQITATVENSVRIGRAYGGMVCLSTQKPSRNSMPSDLRDNCALRVALQTKTQEAERMILGERSGEEPDRLLATKIGKKPGVAITENEGGDRERIRFVFYRYENFIEDLREIKEEKRRKMMSK